MIIYFETQADYVNWLAGSVQTPRVVAYINSVHEYVYRTGDVSNSLVCRQISDINEENTLPYIYDEIISFESNLSQDQPGEVNPDNPGTGEEIPVPAEPIYSGMIYEQDAPKTYTKDQLSGVYENYCIIGALLSKNGDGNWTVWNTNPTEENYWGPKSDTITTPSEQYGEVVAVCVGRGLWAKIGWSGLTTGYKWAASQYGVIYNNYHAINIHGNGWESTTHMFTVHSDYLTGTIWEQLKNGKTADYDLYLPSKYELLDIYNNTCDGTHKEQSQGSSAHTFNKNLGKLLSLSTYDYWSSNQYADANPDSGYGYAFNVNFGDGYVRIDNKTSGYRSIALLHFN